MPRSVENAIKEGLKDEFWALRGQAVHAFGNLEQQLIWLFAAFMNVNIQYANSVFLKIYNASVQRNMLSRLCELRCEPEYTTFFNSYLNIVGHVTEKRDRIVHWAAAVVEKDDKFVRWQLMYPDYTDSTSTNARRAPLVNDDLKNFIHKCEFLSRLGSHFHTWIAHPEHRGEHQSWRDIFVQPVIYPPPNNHPLFQILQEPENLLRSSVRWVPLQ